MNRCTCALFLAVVMLIPVYVRAGLELEPNNSSAQAQVISFGKSVSETLSSNQDEDWAVVYASASGLCSRCAPPEHSCMRHVSFSLSDS